MTDEQSSGDPIRAYHERLEKLKAYIEDRVGAPKKYSDMSEQELLEEHHRLACGVFEGNYSYLAQQKLSEALGSRRKEDMQQLYARLDTEPVPEGSVRVFRGEDTKGLGQYLTTEAVAGKSGKWFSTDLDKAVAFAGNKGKNGRIRYMDIPISAFDALSATTATQDKRDIQVPVGYDTPRSKILMPDGSIPPEILENVSKTPQTP